MKTGVVVCASALLCSALIGRRLQRPPANPSVCARAASQGSLHHPQLPLTETAWARVMQRLRPVKGKLWLSAHRTKAVFENAD